MRGRLKCALRAGFTTLLMGLLVSAALLALLLALETTFAHHHPEGTHTHLHPFELFVGNSLPALPTTVGNMQLHALPAPLLARSSRFSPEPRRPYQSRAPPGAIS